MVAVVHSGQHGSAVSCLLTEHLAALARSRARTLDCRRKPDDVVAEHRKRATVVWVALLLSVVGCKEYHVVPGMA